MNGEKRMSSKLVIRLIFLGLVAVMVISLGLKFINEAAVEPSVPENAKKVVVSKEDQPKEEEEEEEEEVVTKTEITKEEFDSKYQLDPEETQYPNGKFELKDGTIVNADYMSYGESELFAYAMVTFYEGKLAEIQLETEASEEEIKAALGLTDFSEDTLVEPFDVGYEITFNPTFHESNVMWYPNEWD